MPITLIPQALWQFPGRIPSFRVYPLVPWVGLLDIDQFIFQLFSNILSKGGDTTDDNYSTFSDSMRDPRQRISKKSREERRREKRASLEGNMPTNIVINKQEPNQVKFNI